MVDESPPPLPPDADEVPESVLPQVVRYLEQKGTIELFSQLANPEGMRYTDLKENLDLSAGSLSRRLEDGQDLGLIAVRNVREDGKNKQKYYATGMGRAIADAALRTGVYELNRQLLDLKRDLEERRAEIVELVKEGGREELSELSPRELSSEDAYAGFNTENEE